MASSQNEPISNENSTTTWTILLGQFLPNVLDKETQESDCLSSLSQASKRMVNCLQEAAQESLSSVVQNGVIPRIFLITEGLETRAALCDMERGVEQLFLDGETGQLSDDEEEKMPEEIATKLRNILSNSTKDSVGTSGLLDNMRLWTWGNSLSKWLIHVLDQSVGIKAGKDTLEYEIPAIENISLDSEAHEEERVASQHDLSVDSQTKSTEYPGYVIIVENCVTDCINQTKDFISTTVDSVKCKLADSSNSVLELGNSTVQSIVQLTSLQTFKDTLSSYSFMEGLQAFSDYLIDVPDLFQEPDANALNDNYNELDFGLLHHEEVKPKVHVVYIGRR